MKRKLLCFALTFVMIFSLIPTSLISASSELSRSETIQLAAEKLVKDYASSHSRSGSAEGAVEDFLRRSINGKGKDWALKANSNTVATIFGSEVFQESMINVLTETIILMDSQGENVFHTYGKTGWHNYYHMYSYLGFRNDFQDYSNFAGTITDTQLIYGSPAYIGPTNRNDDALEIIAGDLFIGYTFHRTAINEDFTTYTIDLHLFDNFDFDGNYDHIGAEGFDTSVDSALKGIGKILAMMLITEFHWYFKESFTIIIPNTCDHNNSITNYTHNGNNYTALPSPVLLSHDKPWVIEYISDGSSPFVLTSTKYVDFTYPQILELDGNIYAHYYELVWLTQEEIAASGVPDAHTFRYHYLGKNLVASGTRKVHLENRLLDDGSNMIYVSLYDLKGNLISDPTALDSHYTRMKKESQLSLSEENCRDISGLDFVINYIGNESYSIPSEFTTITILPYGTDNDNRSAMDVNIISPGCLEGGYTLSSCRLCGYSFTGDTSEALGHEFGEYTSDGNATCTAEGTMSAKCIRCNERMLSDQKSPALGHNWNDGYVSKTPTTTEEGILTYSCILCEETKTEPIAKLPSGLFDDVSIGSWYEEAVYWAVAQGITTGISDKLFAPNNPCTRAQVVTFLWRAFGKPESQLVNAPFEDVNENNYFYEAVAWAVENGITTGTDATHFSPGATCTRAQVTAFMYRALGSPELTSGNIFNDVSEGAWYESSVIWALENGITTGTSETAFSPSLECTRAQTVSFLYRLYN